MMKSFCSFKLFYENVQGIGGKDFLLSEISEMNSMLYINVHVGIH